MGFAPSQGRSGAQRSGVAKPRAAPLTGAAQWTGPGACFQEAREAARSAAARGGDARALYSLVYLSGFLGGRGVRKRVSPTSLAVPRSWRAKPRAHQPARASPCGRPHGRRRALAAQGGGSRSAAEAAGQRSAAKLTQRRGAPGSRWAAERRAAMISKALHGAARSGAKPD